MLVSPAGMTNNGGFGNGFGGDGWWILLLFLLIGGNGFGGGYGNNGGLYPWLNNSQNINDGFREQMLNDNVTSIRDGIFGISTQLCNGFAGTNAAIANGFAQSEIAANARQIADMQQNFALQSTLQQCCCDNRAGIADLKYTVATENCADRAALSDALRSVIEANTASTQRILDQMCADKIDAKNDTIAQLRQELLYARGQASQDVQTATIRAGQATTANQLIAEMRACPVPSMPVYGMTPIFTCGNNSGCGCGFNVSVENTSAIPATPAGANAPAINVQNANLVISRIA